MTTITNNKLTDETLKAWKTEAIISLGETARDSVDYSHHEAILALVTEIQEHRKAAAEPVLYVMGMGYAFDAETASTCKGAVDSWVGEWNQERLPGQEEYKTVPLYTAPPASERERIRREHAEWSDKTFGDVGPVGPLKHLSKEALEAAAEPDDLSEWADMQFLLWDAQRRAGITDKQITLAMVEKLAINKARQWPEPKDGEPRLHINEQPAPVVPDEITSTSAPEVFEIAAEAERIPVSQTYELPELIEGMEVSVDVSTCDFDAAHRYFGTVTEVSELDSAKNGYILLVQDAKPNFDVNGNSPVIPDGWISCSERMPEKGQRVLVCVDFDSSTVTPLVKEAEYTSSTFRIGPNTINTTGKPSVTHWMPVPAAPDPEVNNNELA